MTISRCSWPQLDPLHIDFVDSNEPETVGVQMVLEDSCVFDINIDPAGKITVSFGDRSVGSWDLEAFRSLLNIAEAELCRWRDSMLRPGGAWNEG